MHIKGLWTLWEYIHVGAGLTCSSALCFFFISFIVRVPFFYHICAVQVCVDVMTNMTKFLSMFDILSLKFDFVKWIYSLLMLIRTAFFKLCYNRLGLYLYASVLCGDFTKTSLLWPKKTNTMTCIINICSVKLLD